MPMDVYGELIRGQLHLSASDLTPTATGLIYYNTSTGPKWYSGSTWLTAADLSTSQVFTNKDIDGGTASNTSRLTLAKASTATLTALTRKEGTLFYDQTQAAPVFDTGSALVALATSSTTQDSIQDAKNYSIACSVGSNALTIALKTKSGADPSGGSSVNIAFRDTTATSGLYTVASCTAATSLVISSGSTLGHRDACESYIYIYGLNNGGAIELVASSSLVDDGSLQSTTAEGGAGAADSATALYSTTARTSKAVKLLGRLKTTQTTAGTWAAVPTEITTGTRIMNLPTSELRLDTGNGHGSVATKVRLFTNSVNVGTAFILIQSASVGSQIIINEAGVYAMSYSDQSNGISSSFGISLNASSTTGITSLSAANRLIVTRCSTDIRNSCSTIKRLAKNDVILPHTEGDINSTSDTVQFTICQLVRY